MENSKKQLPNLFFIKTFVVVKHLLLISVLTLLVVSVNAQQLEVQAYVQETIVGLQKGYSMKMMNSKEMKFGMFYQSTQNFSFNEGINNYPFLGTEFSYPVTKCGKIKLFANLKGGLVNYQFLALVPELETVVAIKKQLSFSMGSSYRAGQAAISFKVLIRPFGQNKFK